jgi:hypothetical protein
VTKALRTASFELGQKFDSFLRNNSVTMDEKFLNDLADASTQASQELGSEGASVIGKQVEQIIAKGADGSIDGQAAYNIKRTLDRIGRRNSPEAWYALDLKGKLMDALDRSVGPEQAASFAKLRGQYGNMLSLEKIAKNGVEGDISVARLANMNDINNPQLQELADIAAQFVKPRENAHGAAQRVFGAGGVLGGAGSAAGYAAGGLAGAATGAAVGGAVTLGTGRALNSALNSGWARDLATGATAPAAPNLLTQTVTKTLPVGAAVTQPNTFRRKPDGRKVSSAEALDNIASAPTVDAAIAAAGSMVSGEPDNADPAGPAATDIAHSLASHATNAQMNPSGTLAIQGNSQALRTALAEYGIRSLSMRGGVVVGRSSAEAALALLRDAGGQA